jgi:hypothetical protein
MKNVRPNFSFLVKRFGWRGGMRRWLRCYVGIHRWNVIHSSVERTSYLQGPSGTHFITGTCKAKCSCCESVRFVYVNITLMQSGRAFVTTHDQN